MRFIYLFCMLALLGAAFSDYNLSYSIALHLDSGGLNLTGLSLIQGRAPDRLNQPETGYTLSVVSFGDSVLYSFKFAMELEPAYAAPRDFFAPNGSQVKFRDDTLVPATETGLVLVVPYFDNAKEIQIRDEAGQMALRIDVSKYAKNKDNLPPGGVAGNPLLLAACIGLVALAAAVLVLAIAWILKSRMKKPGAAMPPSPSFPSSEAAPGRPLQRKRPRPGRKAGRP